MGGGGVRMESVRGRWRCEGGECEWEVEGVNRR